MDYKENVNTSELKNDGKLHIFSFFSGCGFLDLGFEKSGYSIDLVNEFSPAFLDAYKYSREKLGLKQPQFGYSNMDVTKYLGEKSDELKGYIQKIHDQHAYVGFIGGPPCPDFSVAGKQKGREGDNGKLSLTYTMLIINQKPDFFLFENVKGLWKTAKHRAFYEELKRKLSRAGYIMTERLCNSLEFGAPQDRDRILLFGILNNNLTKRIELRKEFPWDSHILYNLEETKKLNWPTRSKFVEDADIPQPQDIPVELTVQYWFNKNDVLNHPNGNDHFVSRQGLPKMQTVEEGDVSRKSYKRLHRWRYSPTVAYGNNEVHLHPYKPRRLTAAEALSLQTLPKDFCLPNNMTMSDKFKTIGNGVPYVMSKSIATTINEYLNKLIEDGTLHSI